MKPIQDRFWSYVNKATNNGCWEWTASTIPAGYGKIKADGKYLLAHRVSWVIHFGEIPAGDMYWTMCVCHHCDNKLCVNPSHLFLGSHKDNMADMVAKGFAPRGENHGSAKLTEKQVLFIRSHYPKLTQIHMARMFGLSQSGIGRVVRRKTWIHI